MYFIDAGLEKPVAESGLIPDVFIVWCAGCSVAVVALKIPACTQSEYHFFQAYVGAQYETQYVFADVVVFKFLLQLITGGAAGKHIFLVNQI